MKKNNLAITTLFVVFLSIFSNNIFAQKTDTVKIEQPKTTCFGKLVLPSSISVNNDAFGDYIKVASLPKKERGVVFSKFSNEQKAAFIKVNLALQFVKRPNMSDEQQKFVLDSISEISADIFDKTDPEKMKRSEQIGADMVNKALGLFTHDELGSFVEPLMTSKDAEVALLQKYESLLENGMKERRKIVKEMPLNDRVNIWKTQLAYHLATGRFSKNQNEFILEMLNELSPETFTARLNLSKEDEAKADDALISKILNVFTREESFAIFMSVGIQKYVKDKPVPTDNLSITCNCNFYCEGDNSCGEPRGCKSSPIGDCGPYGLTRCNYLCSPLYGN